MSKITKVLLALGVMGAAAAASPASAIYWGSGWQMPGTTGYFTVLGVDWQDNTCQWAVGQGTGSSAATNTTWPTRYYASHRCRRNVWPNDIVTKNGPVVNGTEKMFSITPSCGAGWSVYRGGVFIDDAL